MKQTISLEDDTLVQLNIWDTAGHERFSNLTPMYYRGAQGALVVYDITQAESLEKAKFWINELNQKVTEESGMSEEIYGICI